jgi:squalene-associated FAD-dependent desaturase
VVIGGGYAGMAAAVELADAGMAVTVYEAAPELGGRARRVHYRGTLIDNGLHIGIGAYRSLLALIARVTGDADERVRWYRSPLDWRIGQTLHLRAPRWPAPLHLLAALASARGLSLAARWQAVRLIAALRASGYRVGTGLTVGDLLRAHGQGEQIVDLLWAPLCVAALNTPAQTASAQVFANVLRDSLGAERSASDLLLPATDLTALFPEPAGAHVQARGGQVLCGQRVVEVRPENGGWTVGCDRSQATPGQAFDALVLAVAPRALAALTADWPALQQVHRCVDAYRFEPITSVYLQYPHEISLGRPMIGLERGPGQWAFDRSMLTGQRGLLGVVLSAAASAGPALVPAVHHQLARLVPGLPAALWTKVITENLATFACTPGLARPGTRTAAPGVFLAGDHVASDYPATLEGAVRSGQAAAVAVQQYLRGR